MTLICGHYGDVDQRVADHLVDEEISVGDFVLTGGEPAALVLIDSVVRLLPGVLGNDESLQTKVMQNQAKWVRRVTPTADLRWLESTRGVT